jgi:predicted nuclease of predicted toxin-antitoxin system
MRFLIDAQLPIGLARMLNQLGHDAKHVYDLNMMQTQIAKFGHGPSKIKAP